MPRNIPTYKNAEEEFSFSEFVLKLANHTKIIIIVPTIICFFMLFYVQFIAKPVYISTAKIMSSVNASSTISQAAGIAAQFGISMPGNSKEQKWVYPEIIKSRTLAKSMLQRKFNTKQFGDQKTLLEILTYGSESSNLGKDALETIAISQFLGMVGVSEAIKTGINTITISGSEPGFVSEINFKLIEELDSHQKKYNRKKTSEARQFIEERIVDVEKELVAAEDSLQFFMDRNRRIENSPALQLERQRLLREVTVLTGVFTTLKQQYETTKIEEVKESDYIIVIDQPDVPLFRAKPKKKLILILSGLLGLGLGFTIAVLKEYEKEIKKPDRENFNAARLIFFDNIMGFFKKKSSHDKN